MPTMRMRVLSLGVFLLPIAPLQAADLPQSLLPPNLFEQAVSPPPPPVPREIVQPIPPPPTFAENAHYLALALYFEGRTDEPEAGLQGIASVIMNRVRSPHFPDTIREVITQGASPGKTDGGCQFSFMCDQYPEDIQLLCQLRPLDLQKYWGENACENRWRTYLAFAERYLINPRDNTSRAVMYYAASMRKPPYWHVDLEKNSKIQLGSHIFARSKKFILEVAEAFTNPTTVPKQAQ